VRSIISIFYAMQYARKGTAGLSRIVVELILWLHRRLACRIAEYKRPRLRYYFIDQKKKKNNDTLVIVTDALHKRSLLKKNNAPVDSRDKGIDITITIDFIGSLLCFWFCVLTYIQ
jgi:hypothetical protein